MLETQIMWCVHDSRWLYAHTSRHDQYPSSAVLPGIPVCFGLWSLGTGPVAGLCLKKQRGASEENNLYFINCCLRVGIKASLSKYVISSLLCH